MLSNIFVPFLARLPSLQAVQIILVDQILDVALHESRVDVEQVPQLLLNLEQVTVCAVTLNRGIRGVAGRGGGNRGGQDSRVYYAST